MLRTIRICSLLTCMALAGCSKAPAKNCTPGASTACACADGKAGAQLCSADGSQLAPCGCAAAVPAVAPAAPAAPTPRVAYTTTLGPLDHVNTKGVTLENAAGILRQDRSRVHNGITDPGDKVDALFANEDERVKLENLAKTSNLPADVQQTILKRNPKVRVEMFDDRVNVTVLDQGTDDPACIVADGKIGGIAWDTPPEEARLPERLATRGWSVTRAGDGLRLIRPDGNVAATSESGMFKAVGTTCTTPSGIMLGSTLELVRKDPARALVRSVARTSA